MKPSCVVLLSGGLDSTVNLYEATRVSNVALALTFDYSQKASKKEIESASATCQKLKVPHKVLNLNWFSDFTKTSLVSATAEIPKNMELDDIHVSQETAKAVWVPNRNGIFLNIAAAFAEGLKAQWVVPGFNIEEGATFTDNTQGYLDALNEAFTFSTSNKVVAKCFTTSLNKRQIVQRGKELGVDFSLLWPCYYGGEKLCKECESCRRYLRATEKRTVELPGELIQ